MTQSNIAKFAMFLERYEHLVLRDCIRKELLIEIPKDVDKESYKRGLVVGIEMEKQRVRKLMCGVA